MKVTTKQANKKEDTKFKKFLKVTGKVGAGFLAFAGTLVGGYLLTPNREKILSIVTEEAKKSPFEMFVDKLKNDVGMRDEDKPEDVPEEKVEHFLKADFNNVYLNYKVENNDNLNTLKVNGELDFRMAALIDIDFNLDLDLDYNGKHFPLDLGFFNNELYFGLKDLRLKCTVDSFDEENPENILATIKDVLGEDNSGFDFEAMIGDVEQYITKFMKSDFSLDTITSLFVTDDGDKDVKAEKPQTSFSIDTQGQVDPSTGDIHFPISVSMTKEGKTESINIDIVSDSDYTIKKVDLGENSIMGINFGGSIDFTIAELSEYVSPAQRINPKTNQPYNYIEMFHYSGWIRKLANFFSKDDNQKFGLNFNADLDYNKYNVNPDTKEETYVSTKNVLNVEGSINVDLSELLDLEKYYNRAAKEAEEAQEENNEPIDIKADIQEFINNVKEKTGFNFQLKLNQIADNVKTTYANLVLSFQNDGNAYLIYNEDEDQNGQLEAVMKVVIDTETTNKIVEKIPALINAISGDSEDKSLSSLLSFLDGTEVKSAIEKGDYSFILDILENLSNDDHAIYLGLNLGGLNIGEDARVDLTLDSSASESAHVLNLSASGISFGKYDLALNANSGAFNPTRKIEASEANSFDKITFVPSVLDQVTELVQEQKTGFAVTASVRDSKNLGIEVSGTGKFDNHEGVKAGFGNLTIDQYQYDPNKIWCKHNIALDVDNSVEYDKEVGNLNEVMFHYSTSVSDGVLRGKVKIQSVIDIVNLIKDFINTNENNPKFTKFIEPITSLLGVSELTNIISEKDFVRLAGKDVVKKIAQFDNGKGLEIVVGGSLLGLGGDLNLKINFVGDNTSEDRRIESISINNLVLGKAEGENDGRKYINLTISLLDYDSASIQASTIDRVNETFLPLDGIKTLLQMGINTTDLNYFHLKGTVDLNILSVINPTLTVEAFVKIVNERVWVYGKITGMPIVPAIPIVIGEVSEDYQYYLFYKQELISEFTFVTYEDNTDNKVGGYFDIKRTINKVGSITGKVDSSTIKHYRATSDYFLDNIGDYLLGNLLGLSDNAINKIGKLTTKEGEKAPGDYANLFVGSNGFTCTGSDTHTISAAINLGGLTNVEELNQLNVTITGAKYNDKEVIGSLHVDTKITVWINIHISADFTIENVINPNVNDTWDKKANTAFNNIYGVNFTAQVNNRHSYMSK